MLFQVAIEADLDGVPSPNRLGLRFSGGRVLLRVLWNGTLDLPYPVPFDLLGENAKGWLQTDYLSTKTPFNTLYSTKTPLNTIFSTKTPLKLINTLNNTKTPLNSLKITKTQ